MWTLEGSGTPEQPWALKTPSGQSDFQAFRDEAADPPALVVIVGKTRLGYQLRCLTDLHEMLRAHGDWMPLGSADEQKSGGRRDGRGLGSLAGESGRRLVRVEEGAPWSVRELCPARDGGPRPGGGRAQPAQQPDAGSLARQQGGSSAIARDSTRSSGELGADRTNGPGVRTDMVVMPFGPRLRQTSPAITSQYGV